MSVRLRLESFPQDAPRREVERHLCSVLRLDLRGVRTLLSDFPTVLPIAHEPDVGKRLAERLRDEGFRVTVFSPPPGKALHCTSHPRLLASARCKECGADLCIVCERSTGGACRSCFMRHHKRKRHRRGRIVALLGVLVVVLLFAYKEFRRRHQGWPGTQRVAIVLVRPQGSPLSRDLVTSFAINTDAVEEALSRQRRRYQPDELGPVELSVWGPVDEVSSPPQLNDTGPWDLLLFNYALSSYASALDERALLRSDLFDARVYVRLSESDGTLESAEGLGQKFGKIGVVTTQVSEEGVDFAWFVTIHEYLHTRGATDKYDPTGRALDPQGLGDPDRSPLYPQETTELMARGRPISPSVEDLPGAPATWVIGAWTAQEIGWAAPNSPSNAFDRQDRTVSDLSSP